MAIAISVLSACATNRPTAPSQKAAEQAWMRSLYESQSGFGTYPDNYQRIVKEYMAGHLKDPESARYTNFRPLAKDLKLVDIKTRQAILGYSTCVSINAKNSYGGYVGARRYWFLIRNGKVVDSLDPDTSSIDPVLASAMAKMIDLTCEMPKVKQQ